MELHHLPDEREIFARIAEGDESAFSRCYLYYSPRLMPFLIRLLGDRDSAEEVIQEIFLKVWLFRDSLSDVGNPRNWLFRATANTARDWLKKQAAARRKLEEGWRRTPIEDSAPPDRTDLQALTEVIKQTVLSFPPQRRRIYELSREEGMKPAEIATQLGLSVNTVKNTLVAALKAIRENVESSGFWISVLLYFVKR